MPTIITDLRDVTTLVVDPPALVMRSGASGQRGRSTLSQRVHLHACGQIFRFAQDGRSSSDRAGVWSLQGPDSHSAGDFSQDGQNQHAEEHGPGVACGSERPEGYQESHRAAGGCEVRARVMAARMVATASVAAPTRASVRVCVLSTGRRLPGIHQSHGQEPGSQSDHMPHQRVIESGRVLPGRLPVLEGK